MNKFRLFLGSETKQRTVVSGMSRTGVLGIKECNDFPGRAYRNEQKLFFSDTKRRKDDFMM